MSRVAVIGGGITGLAAAHYLKGRVDVLVLEAGARPGGKFATIDLHGTVFESGPDSWLASAPHVEQLAAAVGLGDELVAPAVFGAHVWLDGELKRVPRTFTFGMPTSPAAALRSGVLSRLGAVRTGADLVLPGPLAGPDVSIADFVRHRFGAEVLEKLVDPLLAGTRAGRAEEISLAAAVPQIDALAREHRSLMRGLARSERRGERNGGPPPFLAPRAGMRRLIEALENDVTNGAEIRTGTSVERIERRGGAYRVHSAAGDAVEADALVLTVPAYAAAAMLRNLNPGAAGDLAGIEYASVATAAFVFPPGSVTLPLDASGLLVPSRERRTLAAATWFSRKWPNLAPADGRIVLKAFAGRAMGDTEVGMDDDRLVAALLDDLSAAVDIRARPGATQLTRWARALPQYAVGHLERIQRIESALESTPGIALAGSAYRGSGISDCVKTAGRAAERLTASGALP